MSEGQVDNLFEDLGFEAEEAINLKIRADLMLDLRRYILARGWTHEHAAQFFSEKKARIIALMEGQIDDFNVDQLICLLSRAGMRVKVEVTGAAA